MSYAIQLLPTEEQCRTLVQALKEYSENLSESYLTEMYAADEIRLEILKKLRERGR